MSRVALALVLLSSTVAWADDDAKPALSDQGIAASIGVATGSHLTPGGLRVAGHYTYQLTEHEWFDGIAAVTYGSGTDACFTDRDGGYVCDHGLLQGQALEIEAAVRHYFPSQGQFLPFARAGIGAGIARFGGHDDVTGGVLLLHAGGGMRVVVSDGIAVLAEADLAIGAGAFGHGIGGGAELGLAVLAGAEFSL